MRKLLLTALMLIGLLLAAGPASATDFCVAPNTTCGGTNVGDLQTALDWAGLSDNADRIFLGAATYTAGTAGFTYDVPTGPVEIIGAGQSNTELTAPANGDQFVLKLLGAAGTSVHDLKVRMPYWVAPSAVGIQTNGDARNVSVFADPVEPNAHTGVELQGGTLENSVVGLSFTNNSRGVYFNGGNSAVRDSSIKGSVGVFAADNGTIERATVQARSVGVLSSFGTQTIASSMISLDAGGGAGIVVTAAGSLGPTIKVDGVDVIGSGQQPAFAGIEASNVNAAAANVSVSVDNSLIRGVAQSLISVSAGAGHVALAVSYSDYDGSANLRQGPNATIAEDHVSNVGNGGFGAGGYADLLPSSPLIDAGDPAEPQGLDVDRKTLVTDGNGDGVARRDVGAVETPGVTPPASGGGEQAPVSSGGSAVSSPTPAPSSLPRDLQAPILNGLSLTHKTFAVGRARTAIAALFRGTRLRYMLSEAATVVVRIVHGKKTAGKLTRRAAKGTNGIAFSGRIGRRALKPGRYAAVVTATDAAGNRSTPKRLSFRVVH